MDKLKAVAGLRDRLAHGGASIGSWMQLANADVAEILGRAGYDWVAVDMEHGHAGHHQLPDIFRALELGGTLPFARLPESTPLQCKRSLDAGAAGIIAPMISNADQAAAVADACRWPPAGTRGVAFSRANLFGGEFADYFEFAQNPFLAVMAETGEAVDNIDQIVRDDRVDAILIGPYDLSASLGVTGDFTAPVFVQAVAEIHSRALAANKAVGLHVVEPDPAALRTRIDEGFNFLAYTIDTVALRLSLQRPDIDTGPDGELDA